MSLDLPQLLSQVQAAGLTSAERLADQEKRLPQALRSLETASRMEADEVRQRLKRAGGRWVGAGPIDEPINAALPPPPHPGAMTVMAADGSQIQPDRHAAALYYLINIGAIRLKHGSGTPPETFVRSQLYHRDEDLYADNEDGLISPVFVNAKRDIGEVAQLADLASDLDGGPALALIDNGLILWLALQVEGQAQEAIGEYLGAFLHELSRLSQTGASVAGFLDRPRHANVLSLLHVLQLEKDSINADTARDNRYRGLTDRRLFAELLPSGHRSSIFSFKAPVNRDFQSAGHEVHFFYLNTGEPRQVARVEIPAWVAERSELVDWAHAGILEECSATGGYPYVLVRAHELAVVTHTDRQTLDSMLGQAMLSHGLRPQPSLKSVTKTWTGGRRRHRV